MRRAASGWGRPLFCALLGWLAAGSALRAEDVTTLSGTTYRDVRMVRVDPDGVTWEHATGMCKVDFNDLPEAVRRAYRYDAKQAAAYRDAQARARQQFAAQMQQTRHEAEERQVQQFKQQTTSAAEADAKPGVFVYRRKASEAAAEQSVGEGIAAKKQAEDLRTKDDGTIWDRRLWAVPVFLFGGDPFHGTAFDPHTDLNSHEFQGSLHHSPAALATDGAHDSFNQPDYQTKSYYEDVERAEAFARGKP